MSNWQLIKYSKPHVQYTKCCHSRSESLSSHLSNPRKYRAWENTWTQINNISIINSVEYIKKNSENNDLTFNHLGHGKAQSLIRTRTEKRINTKNYKDKVTSPNVKTQLIRSSYNRLIKKYINSRKETPNAFMKVCIVEYNPINQVTYSTRRVNPISVAVTSNDKRNAWIKAEKEIEGSFPSSWIYQNMNNKLSKRSNNTKRESKVQINVKKGIRNTRKTGNTGKNEYKVIEFFTFKKLNQSTNERRDLGGTKTTLRNKCKINTINSIPPKQSNHQNHKKNETQAPSTQKVSSRNKKTNNKNTNNNDSCVFFQKLKSLNWKQQSISSTNDKNHLNKILISNFYSNNSTYNISTENKEDTSVAIKTFVPFSVIKCEMFKSSQPWSSDVFINWIKHEEISEVITQFIGLTPTLFSLSLTCKIMYKHINYHIHNYWYKYILNVNGSDVTKIKRNIFKSSNLTRSDTHINKIYDCYLRKTSKYSDAITMDIDRTFTDIPDTCKRRERCKQWYNVLHSFSNYNETIGYAQGISFIVGNSMELFKSEEELFLFLDGWTRRLRLEQVFGTQNWINQKWEKIEKSIMKYVPNIITFLSNNSLNHEFFSASWILTWFSNTMEQKYLFIVWDCLIIWGWDFFNYFIVAILLKYETEIVSKQIIELGRYMKELLKSESFSKAFNGLVYKTFRLLEDNK